MYSDGGVLMITATNKITGEVIELPDSNYAETIQAWRMAQEFERIGKLIKDQLKESVGKYIDVFGKGEAVDGYKFNQTIVQRKTYDKSIMKELLDQDLYDILVIPDKTMVDNYIKENLESLGDVSTTLRETMLNVGKPYEIIRLERVKT